MKEALFVIACQSVALALAVGATLLALNGKEGWGWFLIFSVCATISIKTK